MKLIDAYTRDSGLAIEVENGWVTAMDAIVDEDGNTYVKTIEVPLREVLKGKHRGCYGGDAPPFRSQREKVKAAAISYLAYWGGDEDVYEGNVLPSLFEKNLEEVR